MFGLGQFGHEAVGEGTRQKLEVGVGGVQLHTERWRNFWKGSLRVFRCFRAPDSALLSAGAAGGGHASIPPGESSQGCLQWAELIAP